MLLIAGFPNTISLWRVRIQWAKETQIEAILLGHLLHWCTQPSATCLLPGCLQEISDVV